MRKKAKVVMLPTKEGIIHKPKDRDSNFHLSGMPVKESLGYLPQHLYITSDDEIKEDDWIVCRESDLFNWEIAKVSRISRDGTIWVSKNGGTYPATNPNVQKGKIIATTDKSLKVNKVKHPLEDLEILPSPSQEFLQEYCKRNGEIEDVEVEYEKKDIEPFPDNWKENYVKWGIKHQPKIVELLKINPDNTINIYIPEEEKLYTRSEVIQIIYDSSYILSNGDTTKDHADNWIEKNLKK